MSRKLKVYGNCLELIGILGISFNIDYLALIIQIYHFSSKMFLILAIFGSMFHVIFCLRDFCLKSRETSLANLSLVSRETVRDSATLLSSLTEKKISSNHLFSNFFMYLGKPVLSPNFYRKRVRVNFRNFHTAL